MFCVAAADRDRNPARRFVGDIPAARRPAQYGRDTLSKGDMQFRVQDFSAELGRRATAKVVKISTGLNQTRWR
jgi:hypothetical protein